MADIQPDVGRAALRNMAVFLSWTLTSFLCHFCAKAFLNSIKLEINTDKDPDAAALQFRLNMWSASLVTLVQMGELLSPSGYCLRLSVFLSVYMSVCLPSLPSLSCSIHLSILLSGFALIYNQSIHVSIHLIIQSFPIY